VSAIAAFFEAAPSLGVTQSLRRVRSRRLSKARRRAVGPAMAEDVTAFDKENDTRIPFPCTFVAAR
jgi:hypothetical protein